MEGRNSWVTDKEIDPVKMNRSMVVSSELRSAPCRQIEASTVSEPESGTWFINTGWGLLRTVVKCGSEERKRWDLHVTESLGSHMTGLSAHLGLPTMHSSWRTGSSYRPLLVLAPVWSHM